jgi:MFS family permease
VQAPGGALNADARRLLAVQALRAFSYGLGSVLIGVALARAELGAIAAGAVIAAMQAGTVIATLTVGRYADRIGRRRCYALLLATMGAAGTVFALTDSPYALALAALTGTVSTDVVESGPLTSLEQAMLPNLAGLSGAAALFAAYNSVATLAGAAGAIAAAGPAIAGRGWLATPAHWLLAYPLAAALSLVLVARLSPEVELAETQHLRDRALGRSRPAVRRLAALFALDSLGGAFVVQTFIAYWLTREFDAPAALVGAVFASFALLQALSFQVAARLAARIGLLRTMVFTHLPSNVLLIAVAFAPDLESALALLLGRFALSQMDVPARQAYVVALVDPGERMAAAAYTNTARYLPRPLGPLLAGATARLAFGAPFLIGGLLKTVYDVALYVLFRDLEAPVTARAVPAREQAAP